MDNNIENAVDKTKSPSPSEVKAALVEKYPTKVSRKRAKHISVIDEPASTKITANARTVPGIITQRGCCYAGCKGVVLGPTRDIINITHGPIGCGFYSWLTRRNQTKPPTDKDENFMTYCFSTDMQEDQIIFGGEKKLAKAIREAYEIFKPKAIAIFSTCPVGLIGDDVHQVAKVAKEELGINVFGFSCEGYKGVSQSAGHHIANNQIFKHVVGTDETPQPGEFRLNLLGEYNIGGDAFVLEDMFEKCGITLVSTFSGNSSIDDFAHSQEVDLNLVMCHRSINYMAEMMETKYGIPWMKVNFIGAEATAKSIRKVAEYFDNEELKQKVETYIATEMHGVDQAISEIRPRLEGKTAMLFVGGSRAHHYQELFTEVGMKTVAAGYEFAHRDDYEGRQVLEGLAVDADSRNIEELHIEKDPMRFKERLTEEKKSILAEKGIEMSHYEGMIPTMQSQTLTVDDISHAETEKLLDMYKPDIFCAGIKEKYGIQKHGIPCKQLHSYDYGGPYAGFKGAIEFYKEIDRMINTPIWSLITPPWDQGPSLDATYGD